MDISPRNNHRVTSISALLVVLFLLLFAVDRGLFNHLIDTSYVWSAQHFGWFWQIFMLANFGVAMFALTRRGAGRKLGQRSEPEFPAFQWVAMVLCTLAGGGVF
jgi:choline-glycine betaine transporter